MGSRGRRIAFGLIVVLVLFSAWMQVRLSHTQGRLEATRRALISTQRTLQTKVTDLTSTLAKLDAVTKSLSSRTSERDSLAGALQTARLYAANVAAELAAAQGSVTAQSGFIQKETTCLQGVQQAVNQISVGDRDGAIASLRAVSDACQAAAHPPPASANYSSAPTRVVYPFDFPDPYVLRSGSTYYGYATNSGLGNVQIIRSTNLVRWEPVGNALPALPSWASPDFTWAPSVLRVGSSYVMYYTVHSASTGLECISSAISNSPAGPFTDDSQAALVCQIERGGSIDPSPFVNTTGAFLLWKSEGTNGEGNRIWSQQIGPTGRTLIGPAVEVLAPTQAWEGGVVEGPSMVQLDGSLLLFFSGNAWASSRYAVGYATCAGPLGPCRPAQANPVLRSTGSMAGPGGQEFFTDTGGAVWMAFHAYAVPNVGPPNSRLLHLDRVNMSGGAPVMTPG